VIQGLGGAPRKNGLSSVRPRGNPPAGGRVGGGGAGGGGARWALE